LTKDFWLAPLFIVVVFSVVYLGFLGGSYLWDWDETVYAAAGKQMFERGDWVVPIVTAKSDGSYFYGDKPIMMYWGMIVSFHIFGVNEFAARFPSAFFGTLSLVLVYFLVRRIMNSRVAFITACCLGSAVFYGVESRSVTTDATLMFWTTAATLCYVIGVFKPNRTTNATNSSVQTTQRTFFPTSYPLCLLLYFCLGMSFLCKGPVGVVLPMAVIGMFMLIKRLPPRDWLLTPPKRSPVSVFVRSSSDTIVTMLRPFNPIHFAKTVWAMRPLTAIVVMFLAAAPWYLLVHHQTGGVWTSFFFGEHNFGRATVAMEGHSYPLDYLWYYPLSLLCITFPASIFFVPSLLDMGRRMWLGTPFRDGYIFAACWALVYVGVFSVVGTKMPNYVFLGGTGAMIIYAAFIEHWLRHDELANKCWFNVAFAVLTVVGVVTAIALHFLIALFAKGDYVLYVVPAYVIVTGITLIIVVNTAKNRNIIAITMFLAATLLSVLILQFGAVTISKHQDYKKMFAAVDAECKEPVYCSFGQFEPSWVFYSNQQIVRYDADEMPQLHKFLSEHKNNGYIITSRNKYEQYLTTEFGDTLREVTTVPYFLKLEKTKDNAALGMKQRELVVLKKM
jgi:4-amino-4-deoxy-L-arabinose transferase-like glycosyltransferase